MKRFYNNTKMSGAFNNVLRVVALLCVLIGVSSSAWAGYAAFYEKNNDEKALSLKLNDVWYNYGISGHGTTDIGTLYKKLNLQEYYYRTQVYDDAVCGTGSQVEFYIDGNATPQVGYVDWTPTELGTFNNNYCQEWKYSNFNVNFPTNYGEHNVYVKVKAKAGTDCSGTICLANHGTDACGQGQGYHIKYKIGVKDVYTFGDGSTNAGNVFELCELTEKDNVVKHLVSQESRWFRISYENNNSSWALYDAVKGNIDTQSCEGTTITTNNDGFLVSIPDASRDAGYSTPIYFYVDLSTNKIWAKASQKAAYKIVFEDGTNIGCTDLTKGEACTNSIDLGEGTYRFKIYKNNVAYYYNQNITNTLSTKTLTQGDQYTTLEVNKYGTCTFTMQESGSNFNLTVGYTKLEEPVLIGAKAVLSSDQKSATISAYLQGSLCTDQSITEYGFVLCSGGNGCIPTLSSIKYIPSSTQALTRGESFTYTAGLEAPDYLIGGVTYGYRAFVTIAGKTYLSRETGYFTLQDDCTQQVAGDPNNPVVFTIDAALGADYENDCKLTYGSLQTAINKLRDSYNNESEYQYVTYYTQDRHESYDLRQPVIFNVRFYDDSPDDQSKAFCYQGNKKAEVSGGGSDSENSLALIFKDFNRYSEDDYTLTIQGASGANRPWLHHVILRNSRNIVLDNLGIFSDPTGKVQDDALEFDVNTMSWNTIPVGDCADANIVVKNCMIGSNGFTGLHASGYDGITFENNEFEAIMAKVGNTDNAVDWGASAKFMFCENIKFIRNNFRGAHATLVWFQDSKNALFMNNVFWNTNQYDDNCSAIRLVNQYGDKVVKNIAFLYNTFYLENNVNTQGYDFLHTSTKESDSDPYKNITFKYNNCYSYDTDVPGTYGTPSLTESDVCPNNYWSVNEGADFSFGDCQDVAVVSMEGLICETTATGPASLKLKVGDGQLNTGVALSVDAITDMIKEEGDTDYAITLTPQELTYDRYNAAIRPNDNTWTLGAYQAQENVEIKKIYWIGISDQWDDRNNWGYYPEDVVTTSKNQVQVADARSADLQRLSCVNTLSDELTVVITEHPLVQTSGGRKWPQLPADFDPNVRKAKIPVAEQVSAGSTQKFAHTIELEYGAAIKGVESLRNGNEHYNNALTSVEIPRSQWVLVGTVVQPMDRSNIKSGKYYLNRLPEVYMHYVDAIDTEGNVTWSSTFTSLEEELEADKIYAVNIPDEYGPGKLSASRYYKFRDKSMVGDGTVSKSFNFDGKFVNDGGLPLYDITPGSYAKLSNTYPCNLSATEIENRTGGQVLYYDYKEGSFKSFDPNNGDVQIKMQHGFLYKHATASTLEIEAEMLADGNTRSRSIATALPVASINLRNGNERVGSSNIIIRLDEQQEVGIPAQTDAEKVFAPNAGTPELYMMAYDKKLVRFNIASATQTIPLGIRLLKGMNVRFEKENMKGFDKVILIDALRGLEHDLAEAPFTTEWLEAGDIEGRYFLNLVPAEDEYIEDDDVTTAVDENSVDASINIYTLDRNVVRIITNNVNLQSVFVSDMLGKTMEYKASGNFKDIVLPYAQGVYVVQVIGDNATRTEKVIVK